jgi:cysteine desulfurase family protein (TIGR01976 family)
MTSLTFNISRSLARTFNAGDTLVVTRLDHDANVSPWLLAAEDRGCKVRWVDFDPEDCTIDLDDYRKAMKEKPRLVAFGAASNATGTINPIKEMTMMAHEAGSLVYIDAVQYAPHRLVDVQEIGCDFLVCSAYKFFGPHVGLLYGRKELLDDLHAYKVRPAPALPPGKFETGTGNFEGYCGVLGTLEYFAWLGEQVLGEEKAKKATLRAKFQKAFDWSEKYELDLSSQLMKVLGNIKGGRIYGITEEKEFHNRVPTFSMTIDGWHPHKLAEALGDRGIYTWDGHYYAVSVVERLGLEDTGGMLRIGAVHYNTSAEIDQLEVTLNTLIA